MFSLVLSGTGWWITELRPRLSVFMLRGSVFRIIRLFVCVGAGMAAASVRGQSDNFDDGNDAGWTRYDPVAEALGMPVGSTGSTWTFPAGGYRLNAATSPSALVGPGRLGSVLASPIYTGFCVSVDLRPGWDAKPDAAVGLLARLQTLGAGTTNGYSFTYQTGDMDVQINRILGEVPSTVSPAVDVTLDPQVGYRLVFLGDGEHLEGRVYRLDDLLTPVVAVSGLDGNFSEGPCGLVVFDNGGNQGAVGTFDNYVATALVPPPLEVVAAGLGQLAVLWPQAPLCFKLQFSDTLATNSWVDVPVADIGTVGTQFSVVVATATIKTRYYRLVRTDML
jgi:hypothetical protein